MESTDTFDEYLVGKKIDAQRFKKGEPEKYAELAQDFGEMHASSFTAQYLFLINPIRRKYLLSEGNTGISEKPKPAARPKMKPKI